MIDGMKWLFAAGLSACVILPATANAGTRASPPPAATSTPSKGNPAPGPKNGFPASPGLEIAKIKANDNAAFKRKSAGT
ncbi:hypothetical protein IQ25_03872 [Novosphingobium taihuense]|uniref:Uncharacterized protein n=1 Tax=Novosphingobium taihuense TaxID=260085 RepID=A0A7W7AAN7_9SPHN|nr:hypothetical protein [Novosphingobium taihuense]TWH79988.1 hypothetical protein IQ25_03872 [Novosphingobium taihuense]